MRVVVLHLVALASFPVMLPLAGCQRASSEALTSLPDNAAQPQPKSMAELWPEIVDTGQDRALREGSSPIPAAQKDREHVAEDWPNFLGPRHDGTSRENGVNLQWPAQGPPVIWRKEIGTGYSSPVVAGEDLILMHRIGDEEIVECFHADTGASKWQTRYPTDYVCQYEYSNGPYSTPAIVGDRVFAWSAEGALRSLDRATGEVIWRRDLNQDYAADLEMFPVAGSVFVNDGRIFLNVGGPDGAGIVALNEQTGETLWTATDDGAGDATAVVATIHGRDYLLMFTAEGLVSLDPATGQVHWQTPFRARAADTSNATTPAIWKDLVLVSAYKAGSLCLRIHPDGTHEELWRERRNLMCQYQNMIAIDGYVYAFSAHDHTLRCVQMETGEVQWKWEPEHRRGQMLAVGNRLVFIFEAGHLATVDVSPEGWKVRSITSQPIIADRCFSSPALSRGRLYLRSDTDFAVVCLGD